MTTVNEVVEYLKERVGTNNYIDVGPGANAALGVSERVFHDALVEMIYAGYPLQCAVMSRLSNPDEPIIFVPVLCPKNAEENAAQNNLAYVKMVHKDT